MVCTGSQDRPNGVVIMITRKVMDCPDHWPKMPADHLKNIAMSEATPIFADMLKQWRNYRHISQLELATRAGVSQRHVSFLETGRVEEPRDVSGLLGTQRDAARVIGNSQEFSCQSWNIVKSYIGTTKSVVDDLRDVSKERRR